uniref:Uncharacterized protein n=1 Tax=Anguilla anguilla TaxID=7936 RepID=A0A0E9SCJ2_ANGAN
MCSAKNQDQCVAFIRPSSLDKAFIVQGGVEKKERGKLLK